MSDQRDQIVKRVVHALDDAHDPGDLVRSYFDDDREVVLEAARQTLEATREEVSGEKLAAAVDRELIEALRFPGDVKRGFATDLYLNRRKAAIGAFIAAVGAVLAQLLIP